MAVVYVEAEDGEAVVAKFGSSDEPFNTWFREQVEEVHGIDISESGPPTTQVHDVQL